MTLDDDDDDEEEEEEEEEEEVVTDAHLSLVLVLQLILSLISGDSDPCATAPRISDCDLAIRAAANLSQNMGGMEKIVIGAHGRTAQDFLASQEVTHDKEVQSGMCMCVKLLHTSTLSYAFTLCFTQMQI